MSAGLPDGCSAHMLPGNSIAAEHFSRYWEASRAAVEQAAREKLLLAVRVYGPERDGYLDYRAEHGLCSPEEYVQALERMNDWAWARQVDQCWHDALSAESDSAGETT